MTASLRVVGIEKLLKKLNAETLTEPAQEYVIREAVAFGKPYLDERLPRATGQSAGKLRTEIGKDTGRISLPPKPLRFIEFGTQLTSGPRLPGSNDRGRVHRRRTQAQWRAGTYRIQPRRFMRQTFTATRRHMEKELIPKAEQMVERAWEA